MMTRNTWLTTALPTSQYSENPCYINSTIVFMWEETERKKQNKNKLSSWKFQALKLYLQVSVRSGESQCF